MSKAAISAIVILGLPNLIYLAISIFFLWVSWRIIKKAGFQGGWIVLEVICVAGNMQFTILSGVDTFMGPLSYNLMVVSGVLSIGSGLFGMVLLYIFAFSRWPLLEEREALLQLTQDTQSPTAISLAKNEAP